MDGRNKLLFLGTVFVVFLMLMIPAVNTVSAKTIQKNNDLEKNVEKEDFLKETTNEKIGLKNLKDKIDFDELKEKLSSIKNFEEITNLIGNEQFAAANVILGVLMILVVAPAIFYGGYLSLAFPPLYIAGWILSVIIWGSINPWYIPSLAFLLSFTWPLFDSLICAGIGTALLGLPVLP